jgi:hemerythrin
MADYAQLHFSDEEDYLRRIDYPDLAAHAREHTGFVEKMTEFSLAATKGVQDVGAVHRYLHAWFLTHILGSDMRYRLASSTPGLPTDPPG